MAVEEETQSPGSENVCQHARTNCDVVDPLNRQTSARLQSHLASKGRTTIELRFGKVLRVSLDVKCQDSVTSKLAMITHFSIANAIFETLSQNLSNIRGA